MFILQFFHRKKFVFNAFIKTLLLKNDTVFDMYACVIFEKNLILCVKIMLLWKYDVTLHRIYV